MLPTRTEEREGTAVEDRLSNAREATEREKNMTLWQSVKTYPKAIFCSMALSLCIVMEGYDVQLLGNFYGLLQFRQKFGNGTQVGQILGLMLAGILADHYGYKKTVLGALFALIGFIFILFFAQNIYMLFVGGVLCGLPWGAFQTLTATYAADVAPIGPRPILTTYVNMCWVMGQLMSTGILRSLLTRQDQWAWRIPYAIQWAFPPPIILGVLFMPESPTWLVRHGRLADAKNSLRHLTSSLTEEEIEYKVSMIAHTNELEREAQEGTSYLDCFRGVNRRRTEIACGAWMAQVWCGIWFGGNVVYLLQQAGFDAEQSFNFGLGMGGVALAGTLCAWFILLHVGRRTLYLVGLGGMFIILLAVGFMGIPEPIFDLIIGPVGYCVVAEIASTRLRIKTVVLARNAYNIASIIANFLNPPILNPTAWNLRGKGGFIWCGFCLGVLIWAYFRLPEPEGLSPAELDMLFEQGVSERKFCKLVLYHVYYLPQMRTSNACDGCTLRRVKCRGGSPCTECCKRSVDCTFLRARRKPGPKGPRPSTGQRIREFQNNEVFRIGRKTAELSDDRVYGPLSSPLRHPSVPIDQYCRYTEIFKQRLSAVWPGIDCDALLLRLAQCQDDHETRSLAAALCAAVIAQLRLPEHTEPLNGISSHRFALDAEHFRTLFDYRESLNIFSVLTSFFLHIYYANTQKLRAASLLLRESVSIAQGMRLDQPTTYNKLGRIERTLRLRLFWLLFVSERLQPLLAPIDELPVEEHGANVSGNPSSGFLRLIQLFIRLERDFIETSAHAVPAQLHIVEREKMSQYQSFLNLDVDNGPFDEAQWVDLFVTRQWIRTLLWEYTVRHFSMSLLSAAWLWTDTLACVPPTKFSNNSMFVKPRDILHSLEQVLSTVGGPNSPFLARLRQCMAEADLPAGLPMCVGLPAGSYAGIDPITEESVPSPSPSGSHSSN
ncbi:hypothetical protein DL764_000453 [Monosporascus ibericus]|uniref:Major facilitator superfamily (MFS) profile domain-containing protein n=1 Tax=Monosporascus ibericus TaxID=155417 RepID=A0A4Q4TWU7_9PEZI|nr:hypothetical protein DL764_000453 [Monosporascus ibericus]